MFNNIYCADIIYIMILLVLYVINCNILKVIVQALRKHSLVQTTLFTATLATAGSVPVHSAHRHALLAPVARIQGSYRRGTR